MDDRPRIKVTKDGPYLVYGGLPLNLETIGTNDEGGSWTWEHGRAFEFAREAEVTNGPTMVLYDDDRPLCAYARFCDNAGTIWTLVKQTDRGEARQIVAEAVDGQWYESRDRVTLCRCGASQNKPFCDGTHADVAFKDGLA